MALKKIFYSFAVLLVLPLLFVFSACDFGVKPIAVCVYQVQADEKVIYTTDQLRSQIYVFASEADVPTHGDQPADWYRACESASILRIQFLNGAAPNFEEDNIYVTVDKWYDMNIVVKSSYYSSEKSIYVNGAAITPTSAPTLAGDSYFFYFSDKGGFVLNRSNPGGRMNGVVNTIEYK